MSYGDDDMGQEYSRVYNGCSVQLDYEVIDNGYIGVITKKPIGFDWEAIARFYAETKEELIEKWVLYLRSLHEE